MATRYLVSLVTGMVILTNILPAGLSTWPAPRQALPKDACILWAENNLRAS